MEGILTNVGCTLQAYYIRIHDKNQLKVNAALRKQINY